MAPGPAPAHTGLSRRGHVVKAAKCIEGISFVFALPFGQFQVEIHHKTKLLILAQVGQFVFMFLKDQYVVIGSSWLNCEPLIRSCWFQIGLSFESKS